MPANPQVPAINLIGRFGAADGVGEAARQIGAALQAGGIEHATIEAGPGAADAPHPLNLICLNPHELPALAAAAGDGLFARPTAGLWWWESPGFPAGLRWAFDYVDEVWVASDFVAEALAAAASVPVKRLTMPVAAEAPSSSARIRLPDGFTFLFVFDLLSAARKNPLGAVEAFARAFEPGEGAVLLLKASGADRNPAAAASLREAAARHPDVLLVEGRLPETEKNALIARCDCFVSLHRCEGFGLTIAEAMYFGRPVIATGWSGSNELIDDATSDPVPYELRPIGNDSWPYRASGEWAEPDLDAAAALMRERFENPERGRELGEAAAKRMREQHSPEAVAPEIAERVTALAAGHRSGGSRTPPVPDSTSQRARRLVERGPAPGPGGGPLRRARNAVLRAIRPFTAHQREVDGELLEAVAELEARVEWLEARRREDE